MTDWKIINKKIRECQQLTDPEKVIDCLLDLFQQTNDGWVAFNLAQEYENKMKLEEALKYYQKAETLLPLPKYKEKARDAISRVKSDLAEKKAIKITKEKRIEGLDDILGCNPAETLLVVSCSPDKIWENNSSAPDFVPARFVYRGKKFLKFLKWVEERKIERQGFFWVILSGKYGFIEPWHPISRYDVNLSDPNHYPISDETLKNQVNQWRWWRNNDGKLVKIRIIDFKKIIHINCSSAYRKKIRESLPNAQHYHIDV